MRNLISLLLAAGFMFSLTACHTVEGVGKDVEHVGDAIEDAADDAHDD